MYYSLRSIPYVEMVDQILLGQSSMYITPFAGETVTVQWSWHLCIAKFQNKIMAALSLTPAFNADQIQSNFEQHII